MDLNELLTVGGSIAVLSMTVIQVVPIKINPWSAILRPIGRMLNVEVIEKIDENEALTVRYRILRFDDEIRHKLRHTEEHFDQILEDITKYEIYCKDHPKFPNAKAVMAIENIKNTYKKCKADNDFLV